jgi:hypothetical protein
MLCHRLVIMTQIVAIQLALLPAWYWDSLLPSLCAIIPMLDWARRGVHVRIAQWGNALLFQALQYGLVSQPGPKPKQRTCWWRVFKVRKR